MKISLKNNRPDWYWPVSVRICQHESSDNMLDSIKALITALLEISVELG